MKRKTVRIDYSRKRLAHLADKAYNEGNYLSALRFAYEELNGYGGDGDVYARLADIYESMGLHGSAVNWWYRFLDIAEEEDLPDIYEGLAVNYMNAGNDVASAYYYNKLLDVDASIPEDMKMDIVDAFANSKKDKFRFVYPPRLADYSQELEAGSKALKLGDCKRAISTLSVVEKGSKDYAAAQEMQAVAHLLEGEEEQAEKICDELLKEEPDNIRILATLAAVYLEQGRKEEGRAIALRLYALPQSDPDELYKVATVCCENGLHREAYEKFCELERKLPYDGRMLYFKGASAFLCGKKEEAERAFDTLCTVYPDAEVARYYLKALRLRRETEEKTTDPLTELSYFYHLPQEERENRCRTLIDMSSCPKDEAQLFGILALHDEYFRWCFDEMDGTDHDLQLLALTTAVHVRAYDFIADTLLDSEVLDVLKVETLRMLYEQNEDMEIGLVLCHIYRRICLSRISVGRKKRNRFVAAYAKIVSKFVVVSDTYGKKLKATTESLYRALEKNDALDLIDGEDDLACAIFLSAGLKELGTNAETIAKVLDADFAKVCALISAATGRPRAENTPSAEAIRIEMQGKTGEEQ